MGMLQLVERRRQATAGSWADRSSVTSGPPSPTPLTHPVTHPAHPSRSPSADGSCRIPPSRASMNP